MLDEILSKVTSYNLFENIVSGGVFYFCTFPKETIAQLSNYGTWNFLIMYYFTGVVFHQLGTVILEKIFLETGFIEYADYESYLIAEKQDDKLSPMVAENIFFRTLIATFVCVLLCNLFCHINIESFWDSKPGELLTSGFIILFSFAHRKRTGYIKERVYNCVTKKLRRQIYGV